MKNRSSHVVADRGESAARKWRITEAEMPLSEVGGNE